MLVVQGNCVSTIYACSEIVAILPNARTERYANKIAAMLVRSMRSVPKATFVPRGVVLLETASHKQTVLRAKFAKPTSVPIATTIQNVAQVSYV